MDDIRRQVLKIIDNLGSSICILDPGDAAPIAARLVPREFVDSLNPHHAPDNEKFRAVMEALMEPTAEALQKIQGDGWLEVRKGRYRVSRIGRGVLAAA